MRTVAVRVSGRSISAATFSKLDLWNLQGQAFLLTRVQSGVSRDAYIYLYIYMYICTGVAPKFKEVLRMLMLLRYQGGPEL